MFLSRTLIQQFLFTSGSTRRIVFQNRESVCLGVSWEVFSFDVFSSKKFSSQILHCKQISCEKTLWLSLNLWSPHPLPQPVCIIYSRPLFTLHSTILFTLEKCSKKILNRLDCPQRDRKHCKHVWSHTRKNMSHENESTLRTGHAPQNFCSPQISHGKHTFRKPS